MKKQIKLLAGLLLLALVICGAYLLYEKFSGEFGGGLVPSDTRSDAVQTTDTVAPDRDPVDAGETTALSAETTVQTEQTEENTLSAAPDFSVTDADGNPVRLSDLAGKPVILNFWATWCPYCLSEMPEFDAMYAEYGDEIQFMMINVTDGDRETVEKASAYVADSGYRFPVYYDTALSAAGAYGAYSLPMTVFIDAEGHYVAYALGMINAETIKQGIGMITAGE